MKVCRIYRHVRGIESRGKRLPRLGSMPGRRRAIYRIVLEEWGNTVRCSQSKLTLLNAVWQISASTQCGRNWPRGMIQRIPKLLVSLELYRFLNAPGVEICTSLAFTSDDLYGFRGNFRPRNECVIYATLMRSMELTLPQIVESICMVFSNGCERKQFIVSLIR